MMLMLTYCWQASDITSLILDQTPVVKQQFDSSSSTHHGELFYATFKSNITQLLITVAADAMDLLTVDYAVSNKQRRHVIAGVITSVLDAVGRDSHLRHRYDFSI